MSATRAVKFGSSLEQFTTLCALAYAGITLTVLTIEGFALEVLEDPNHDFGLARTTYYVGGSALLAVIGRWLSTGRGWEGVGAYRHVLQLPLLIASVVVLGHAGAVLSTPHEATWIAGPLVLVGVVLLTLAFLFPKEARS